MPIYIPLLASSAFQNPSHLPPYPALPAVGIGPGPKTPSNGPFPRILEGYVIMGARKTRGNKNAERVVQNAKAGADCWITSYSTPHMYIRPH